MAVLKLGTMLKVGDEQQAYVLQTHELFVCFTLCSGGHSDPIVMSFES
jgi:hypothetical protein